jgi:hypothetical protein
MLTSESPGALGNPERAIKLLAPAWAVKRARVRAGMASLVSPLRTPSTADGDADEVNVLLNCHGRGRRGRSVPAGRRWSAPS